MHRSYKYRLYPNSQQEQALGEMLGAYRELYNAALEERREAWRRQKVSINYYDQGAQLKEIRALRPDFARFNFSAAQLMLRRLDKAFQAFFRRVKAGEKPGYPRFKSRARFNSAAFRFGDGCRLVDARLFIQGVGKIKVKWHRSIPEGTTIKQVAVKRNAGGHWYAVFQLVLPNPTPAAHQGEPVGVDLGISTLAALSTGELVAPPRCLRQSAKKLRRQQRRAARRKKFSQRWKRAIRQIARTHQKVANQRRDVAHKLSRRLANEFSMVAVEKLNIAGLAGGMLAKDVHDAGWSELLAFLSYKVEETGSQMVAVDPRHTSQACSGCGVIVEKALSVRVHRCPDCGLVLDRDHNAAVNILQRALSIGPDGAVRYQRGPSGRA